ncbi:MAG TPA: GNAT family N-acetyltransferase [Dehalococcoidales bacterium]|nr:GNAT family N-acetyltransferase [Dehalococcoidales bacterium]
MKELTYKFVENETELKGAFEVRRQVFVEEQGVAGELEFDKDDREALHMVVKDGQGVIGTARVLFFTDNQAKLERIAVLKPLRRRGIGRGIISFLDEELENGGVEQVVLHAQCVAAVFYRSCGFVETGSTFWEVGIKHIKMQKRLVKA